MDEGNAEREGPTPPGNGSARPSPVVPATRASHSGFANPVAVRLVEPNDLGELCAVLARAFEDDPVARYIFPSARRRPPGLRSFFRLQVGHDLLGHGGIFTTPDLAGAAVWSPPNRPTLSGLRGTLALLPVAPYVLGTVVRTVNFLARMESFRPTEPHWHLATLGTEPARQGQGVGSALLAPVLSICDREGIPAYLESSKARNVPFYRRHGFEVTQEIPTEGGPTLWTMWRRPRAEGG